MQKYLAGGGAEENPAVGSTFSVSLDANRYNPTIGRWYITADTSPSKSDRGSAPLERKDLGEQPLVTDGGALQLKYSDTKPGAYVFVLSPTQGEGQSAKPPEFVSTVLNVDTAREGALQRAKGNDPQTRPRAPKSTPGTIRRGSTRSSKSRPTCRAAGGFIS
jgi:hypothetical protein